MTSTDLLQPSCSTGADLSDASPRGPFRRTTAGSLAFGAVAAAALTLGALPGAVEHVTTGAVLLAFAAGWALLAALTTTLTNRPQSWAYALAGFLAVSGAALLLVAPGDDGCAVLRA